MKIESSKVQKFNPIKIEIIVESEDELTTLKQLVGNASPNSLVQAVKVHNESVALKMNTGILANFLNFMYKALNK